MVTFTLLTGSRFSGSYSSAPRRVRLPQQPDLSPLEPILLTHKMAKRWQESWQHRKWNKAARLGDPNRREDDVVDNRVLVVTRCGLVCLVCNNLIEVSQVGSIYLAQAAPHELAKM
ncbi:hypothetical protein J6590_081085 [Homalodisca vitripennis]|nr:hypothetical protein J6590_081085 [Homalodisca vitripennis]